MRLYRIRACARLYLAFKIERRVRVVRRKTKKNFRRKIRNRNRFYLLSGPPYSVYRSPPTERCGVSQSFITPSTARRRPFMCTSSYTLKDNNILSIYILPYYTIISHNDVQYRPAAKSSSRSTFRNYYCYCIFGSISVISKALN